jgi:hypothetical protein
MIRHTLSTLREQAATMAVAAVMTLAMVAGLAGIADHQHAGVLQSQAAAETAVQQVVVIGQRSTQS